MAYVPGITSGFSIKIGAAGAIVLAATKATQNTPSAVSHARAAGQHKSLDSWPAEVAVNGSLDWIVSSGDQTVLDVINPTGSPEALEECEMIAATFKHTGCKVNSLKLDAVFGKPLMGSLGWEGMAIGSDTNPGAPTTNAFKCTKLTTTGLGSSWEPVQWIIDVALPVNPVHAMNATGSRLPVVLGEGFQGIKMNCKLTAVEDTPADITAVALAQIPTVTLALEDTEAAPQSLTVTLTKVTPADTNKDLSPEDILFHGLDYEAETIAFAIV